MKRSVVFRFSFRSFSVRVMVEIGLWLVVSVSFNPIKYIKAN